jgi:hypothetical protein
MLATDHAMPPTVRLLHRSTPTVRLCAAWLAVIALAGSAAAADRPADETPLRLLVGGEVSGSIAPSDQGFFNEIDYHNNALRLFRASLAAELRAGSHLAVLGELRSDNLEQPGVYGLYLRLRPFRERDVDLQVGRIPPVFGAYTRRRYGKDNPLIGDPLAYQYLTSLRPDAVPASADEMLAQRGEGWLTQYSVGSSAYDTGLPVVRALRWDTGVELRLASRSVSWATALTRGTLANPLFHDDNDGEQLSTRLAWRPRTGLEVGGSLARGNYLARDVYAVLPASAPTYRQRALGLDIEYSWDRWLVRSEAIASEWGMPPIADPRIDVPLKALGFFVEARCRVAPGLTLAARAEHLGFSHIAGSAGPETWDADVTRLETGASYALRRHVQLKAAFQHDRRDGGLVRSESFLAGQVLLWF